MTEIKCKNCAYYTGMKCQGHGEYWGQCMLLEMAYKEINRHTTETEYTADTDWETALTDNSKCIFIRKEIYKIKEFKK